MAKERIKVHCGMTQFYNWYKKKSKNPIDKGLYSKIIKEYNMSIRRLIVYEAFEYVMPFNIGTVRIKKIKQKLFIKDGKIDTKASNLLPDWKRTKELWTKDAVAKEQKKLVYMLNEHTDGYRYRWYYTKYRNPLKNKSVYSLTANWDSRRMVARVTKSGDSRIDYFT